MAPLSALWQKGEKTPKMKSVTLRQSGKNFEKLAGCYGREKDVIAMNNLKQW